MSGALGNLLIKLTADTGEATGDIGKAAHQIERDMQQMATRAAAVGSVIGNVMADVAVSIGRAAKEAVMFGDQLSKLSQRTGIAVGRLSEIAYAGDLADVSIGSVASGMAQFNKALVDANRDGGKAQQMFEALGVSIKDGPQVAFDQMAKAINTLSDGETKVAAMRAAFGKSGDAMIPLIAGLDDATDKARKLGLTMSEDMARNSEVFNDSMTTLGAATGALVRNALTPLLAVLADISTEMVTAASNGNFLQSVLFTLGRAGAATIGGLANMLGDDKVVDEAAAAFAQMRVNPESFAARSGGAAVVDQDRLRAALSGSNKGSKGGRGKKSNNMAGDQWQWWMEEEAKIMAEAAAATDKYNQTVRESAQAAVESEIAAQVARAESIVQMDEIINKQTLMANGFDENGKAIEKAAKKANDWGREMGLTFSSAFEDMIVKGAKFSDVLRGIGQDLIRIAARKLVTDPLGDLATTGLDALIKMIPSYDVGTPYVPQDTLAMVHKGERIIPASQNNGMGGGPTIYADMRGASVEAVQRLEQMVMALDGSIEPRAVSAVADTRRRGGSMARSF